MVKLSRYHNAQLLKYIINIKRQNLRYKDKVLLINRAIQYYTKLTINSSLNQQQKKNFSKKYGLFVGINYKNTPNELNGCINDAYNIKSGLINALGFEEKYLTILTDYTKIKPTKANILSNLRLILQKAKSGDIVVFTYSGHGTNIPTTDISELSGTDQFIVPLNFTNINSCIMDNEFKNIFTNNLKDGVKVFILMDSCYSGTILDIKYSYLLDNTTTTYENPNIVSINKGQIICISGCNDVQTSADASVKVGNKYMYAGAMTYALLNVLKQKGVNISFQNLINDMRKLLNDNKFTQIPQLSSDSLIDINNLTLMDYLTTKK